MWFIGDAHAQFGKLLWMQNNMILPGGKQEGFDCSLQIGDFGIFDKGDIELLKNYNFLDQKEHKFIRGNHDNPELIKPLDQYLGDYGYLNKQNLFYLSGGWSIDKVHRTENIDWWADEELSYADCQKAIEIYRNTKPSIMVSHECPTIIKDEALLNSPSVFSNGEKIKFTSKTEHALQAMYDIHQPDIWIFGHYHTKLEVKKGKTLFICLNELVNGPVKDCFYEIKGLTW